MLNTCLVFSQKESANWYFGEYAGVSFNTGSPVIWLNGKLVTSEGCATILDPSGNLLFYTDGVSVWDDTFNEQLLTSDDYWYYLKLPNGEVYRGHFALKNVVLIPN